MCEGFLMLNKDSLITRVTLIYWNVVCYSYRSYFKPECCWCWCISTLPKQWAICRYKTLTWLLLSDCRFSYILNMELGNFFYNAFIQISPQRAAHRISELNLFLYLRISGVSVGGRVLVGFTFTMEPFLTSIFSCSNLEPKDKGKTAKLN